MVKRILAVALAVALFLSLAACNDDSAKLPNISTGDSGVLGTDFQKNMNQSTAFRKAVIISSSSGFNSLRTGRGRMQEYCQQPGRIRH